MGAMLSDFVNVLSAWYDDKYSGSVRLSSCGPGVRGSGVNVEGIEGGKQEGYVPSSLASLTRIRFGDIREVSELLFRRLVNMIRVYS
jgi:hypothetical protein